MTVISGARIAAISRAGLWLGQLALSLLLVQSTFWSGHVPWSLKLLVAGTAVLAAFRPSHALMVVAGLAPLGHAIVTRIWDAYPFGLSEALVLAFFVGYLWHRRPGARSRPPAGDGLDVPVYLLSLIVVASGLVQVAVLQFQHDFPLEYARNFIRFLATDYLTSVPDYRPWVDGRGFVNTAALLVEGVALLLCARTLCRREPALGRRVVNVVIAAGVGVAALSIYQPVAEAIGHQRALSEVVTEQRWGSPAIPSLSTAAGFFMLVALVGAGAALAAKRHRLVRLVPSVVCLLAMWLTQTRSALTAAVVTVVGGAAWPLVERRFKGRWIPSLAAVGLLAIVVGTAVVLYDPLLRRHSAGASLGFRLLFAETALRMIARRPLFGVGVGQYLFRSAEFSPPELLASYPNSFAHNMFLWQAAELGLVGLGAFVWVLAAAFRRLWSGWRERRSDFGFLGLCVGLVAFVITWLAWQVMYAQAAFTFWILLGVAVAQAAPAARPAAAGRRSSLLTASVAVVAVAILLSVPLRVRRDIATVNPNGITYGFYNWDLDAAGLRYRWTRPHAAFLLRAAVERVEVPVSAAGRQTRGPVELHVFVDDRLADRITLRDDAWHRVILSVPPDAQDVWKVELRVSPAWIPSATVAGSSDDRELGVRVGEIVITMNGETIVLK